MKAKLLLILAIVAAAAVGIFSMPNSAEQDKDSVLIVETTVEVPPNPFMFFFGNRTATNDELQFGGHPAAGKPIVHYHGTAFVVDGHLITAAHVVLADKGEKVIGIEVTRHDGKTSKAKVLRSDKDKDLAELETQADINEIPSLSLATRTPRVGDKVFEIGHPALILYVVSRGEIVGFDNQQGYDIAAMDTFGGDSGGPVIDRNGKVMGVCHTLIRGSRFTGIGTLVALTEFLYPGQVR